ncbi:HtaA domain-containing protein [Streptomyces sp. T-3]|nr:HtaA domain-containing protein [Streptomyces sp. T-3]
MSVSSSRRATRAGVVLGFAALVGALLPAATAEAADRTVQGGRLDWGIKSSFQSYVTGPIAKGSYTLQGGAATAGGSLFRFHSATGSYSPDSGAFDAAFSGGVRFTGHKKADGTNELDLTVSRPHVKISGGSGTLYADMVSKDKGSGKVTSTAQVPLASLNLSGVNMKGGSGPIALTDIPATLTSQGAKAFAGYYTAGTPLDPVSLSTDLAADSSKEKPSKDPEEGDKDSKDEKKGKGKAEGRIEDAAVDWGVRRTFREYVTGSIAKGKWTLADGAQDGGALFRFAAGSGTYDEEEQQLDADFKGSVRFTGKHGLDVALSRIAVVVEDGKGTLYADVTASGTKEKRAPIVTFAAKQLKPADGLVSVSEAPAELTKEGAKAFNDMYKAGTEMDPVSLAVALDGDAKLPALPDLGSSAEPSAKPEKKAEPRTGTASSSSSPALPIGIGVAVLLAAGVAFGVVRKRRTAGATTAVGDAGNGEA